jgi:hypothetical protein
MVVPKQNSHPFAGVAALTFDVQGSALRLEHDVQMAFQRGLLIGAALSVAGCVTDQASTTPRFTPLQQACSQLEAAHQAAPR